jgi:rubredoxin
VITIGEAHPDFVPSCSYCTSLREPCGRHQITAAKNPAPIPMLLWCPECGARHVDVGEFATKPHHTHACQHCGHVWRPAIVPTTGVQFLPGFKNP